MRLQQFLAHCGIASRRKAEDLIKEGKVTVNGKIITDCAFNVEPEKDFVKYNNKLIKPEKKIYIVLNKPKGFISSVSDEKGRKTVIDIFKNKIKEHIYPVGRLDYNTTGCLILTNDGEWANKIIHPRYEVEKVYIAKIKGRASNTFIDKLKKGIKIEDGFVKAKDAKILLRKEKNDVISITITQGKNHQIKKMLQAIGLTLLWLKRQSVGPVNIRGLEYGMWRYLTQKEIDFFNKI